MTCFTPETQRIISAHKGDFNCDTCQAYLKRKGGYIAYLKELGGTFKKWAGKTAKARTAVQFQEIAQYVFGLMAIYGFDYNNGNTYVKWGGGSPYYPSGKTGDCNWGLIDDLCCNPGLDKTTNCNFGMDSLYYKAGIMPAAIKSSDRFKGQVAAGMKIIRKKDDLRIGDLVHFFHSEIRSDDPDTWSGWGHVACVGEIVGTTVYTYDSGNRFIRSGNFKCKFTVDKNNHPTGTYDNYDGWVGIRVCMLIGSLGTEMYTSDLAVATLHGDYGSGDLRKAALGDKYDGVQTRVNYYCKRPQAYKLAKIRYTLRGYAGSGVDRRAYWGGEYNAVQGEVDKVVRVANEIMSGSAKGRAYGKMQTRIKRIDRELGDGYGDIVQKYIDVVKGVRKRV